MVDPPKRDSNSLGGRHWTTPRVISKQPHKLVGNASFRHYLNREGHRWEVRYIFTWNTPDPIKHTTFLLG